MSPQYADRVWHFINSVKHIHVHTQRETERCWYRWKWEVREIGFTSRLVITPTITPLTHAHTHFSLNHSYSPICTENTEIGANSACVGVCQVFLQYRTRTYVCVGPSAASGFLHSPRWLQSCRPSFFRDASWQQPETWHGRGLASSVSLWWQTRGKWTSKSSSKMSKTLLLSWLSINDSRIRLFVPSLPLSSCCPVYSCVFVSPVRASGLHVDKRSFHLSGKTPPPPLFFQGLFLNVEIITAGIMWDRHSQHLRRYKYPRRSSSHTKTVLIDPHVTEMMLVDFPLWLCWPHSADKYREAVEKKPYDFIYSVNTSIYVSFYQHVFREFFHFWCLFLLSNSFSLQRCIPLKQWKRNPWIYFDYVDQGHHQWHKKNYLS